MTNPPALEAWLAGFKQRHDIGGPLGADEHLAEERAQLAADYTVEHIPARYAEALPTQPEVDSWIARVLKAAAEESRKNGRLAVSIHTGPSLLLVGSTGVGKTYEAYGAMRAIAAFGLYAKWVLISAADLYARLRPRHGVDSEAEFRAIADAPLLAVDDLGAAKTSEWVEEVNFRLVNRRYEMALPTLFTSNVPPKQLSEVLGERVASRLVEMTERVAMKGADRRRAA